MLRSCICLGGRLRTGVGRATRKKAEQLRRLPANRRRTTPAQCRKQSRSGSASVPQSGYKQSLQKWLKGNQKMSPKQVSALRQFDHMISTAQKRKEDMILQAILRAQHDFKKQKDEADEMEKAETERSRLAQKIFAQNKKIAEVELQKIEHEKKTAVDIVSIEKERRAELRREAALRQREIAKAERECRRVPKVLLTKIRQEKYEKQKATPYSEEERQFFKMLRELEAKREAAINTARQKIEENERLTSERNAEKSFLEELKLIKEKRAAVINKIKEEAKAERERERKEMMQQKQLERQQRLEERLQKRREQEELRRQRREQMRMEREEKRRQLQLEKERKKEEKELEQLEQQEKQEDKAHNVAGALTQLDIVKENEPTATSSGANIPMKVEESTKSRKRNVPHSIKTSFADAGEMSVPEQTINESTSMQRGITTHTEESGHASTSASAVELNENGSNADDDLSHTRLASQDEVNKAKSSRRRRESSHRKPSTVSKAVDAKPSLQSADSANTERSEASHTSASQVIIAPVTTVKDAEISSDKSAEKTDENTSNVIPLPASTNETSGAFASTSTSATPSTSSEQEEREISTLVTPTVKHKQKKTSETKPSASPADSSTSELTEAMKNYYNLLQHEKNRVLASSALSQPVIPSHNRTPTASHKRATSVTSSSRTTASATLSASAHGKRSGKRDSTHSTRHSLSVIPHNELTKTPSGSSSPSVRGSHGAVREGHANRVLRPSTVATWATQQNTSGLFRL